MREIIVDAGDQTRTIAIEGRTLQACWTIEAQEDMAKYYNIDIATIISEILVKKVNFELTANNENSLTDDESADLASKIKLAVQ